MIPLPWETAAEIILGLLCGIGLAQALAGWWVAHRFATAHTVGTRHSAPADDGAGEPWPAITVLKPLHGDEPLLEQALASVCAQDYPRFQVIFGVQDGADPAIAVVERLKTRFPDRDIVLVIDPAWHGPNLKVGNLINMFQAARHDVIMIADSDLHVRPDYLRHLVEALGQPGVGLVTTLYAGLPAIPALPARLGATQITHGFLPGALLARAMGRQDCLGATMALRRETLERIGGLRALVPHLADDNVLGQLVARLGLRVALAGTVPLTTVPEATVTALFRHELRWARTIRRLEPVGFAASVLQYPLAWSLLLILVAAATNGGANWGASWPWGVFALAWAVRSTAARGIDRALSPLIATGLNPAERLAIRCPVWLLPAREIMAVSVMLASYAGKQVDWRGHGMQADNPNDILRHAPPRSAEGLNPR